MSRYTLGLVALLAAHVSGNPNCTRMGTLYQNGKDMCETMWGGAFKYTNDKSKAYTMWFFDAENPNDQVTANIKAAGQANWPTTLSENHCHLNYYHKDGAPTPEPDTLTECHPWQHSSCCNYDTVVSAKKINEAYGPGYHWDRCGALSPACERFFVQEACFYECDPNIGLWRKYWDQATAGANYNEWEIEGMPIDADYCDAMFRACKNDLFCGVGGGNYFSCAVVPDAPKTETPTTGGSTTPNNQGSGASVVINMYNSGGGNCPNN